MFPITSAVVIPNPSSRFSFGGSLGSGRRTVSVSIISSIIKTPPFGREAHG